MGRYYAKQFIYTSHLIYTQPCGVGIINVLVLQMPWRRLYVEESSERGSNTPRYVWLYPTLSTLMAHWLSLLSLKSPGDIGRKHSCPLSPLVSLRILFIGSTSWLSSPKYMISVSPSLGANTGDSPVPTFHLFYAPLQGGAHNPTRHFYRAVQSTIGLLSVFPAPSVRWNKVSVGSHFMFRLNSNPRVFCLMIFPLVKPCFPILCLWVFGAIYT